MYQNKLAAKVNRMEDELNKLKEFCIHQNESISTVFQDQAKSCPRSKSIDYNGNYYSQTLQNEKSQRLGSENKNNAVYKAYRNYPQNHVFRNTTPEVNFGDHSISQNTLQFNVGALGPHKVDPEYHSQEKLQKGNIPNWPNFVNLKKSKKKKSKKKKYQYLQAKIDSSLQFNKLNAVKNSGCKKQIPNLTSCRTSKLRGSKMQKKIDQYNISMKQGIKRYTPVSYPISSIIEVQHLNSMNVPSTARQLGSSSNSKGSIGESSVSKYWSGHNCRHAPSKFGPNTITEVGTRETSCNKDSHLHMGSFEVIGFKDRLL